MLRKGGGLRLSKGGGGGGGGRSSDKRGVRNGSGNGGGRDDKRAVRFRTAHHDLVSAAPSSVLSSATSSNGGGHRGGRSSSSSSSVLPTFHDRRSGGASVRRRSERGRGGGGHRRNDDDDDDEDDGPEALLRRRALLALSLLVLFVGAAGLANAASSSSSSTSLPTLDAQRTSVGDEEYDKYKRRYDKYNRRPPTTKTTTKNKTKTKTKTKAKKTTRASQSRADAILPALSNAEDDDDDDDDDDAMAPNLTKDFLTSTNVHKNNDRSTETSVNLAGVREPEKKTDLDQITNEFVDADESGSADATSVDGATISTTKKLNPAAVLNQFLGDNTDVKAEEEEESSAVASEERADTGTAAVTNATSTKDLSSSSSASLFPPTVRAGSTAPRVAYVLPVIECPVYRARDHTAVVEAERERRVEQSAFFDAAAVLKQSLIAVHAASRNYPDFETVALLHADVAGCRDAHGYDREESLRMLGYRTIVTEGPVRPEEIRNPSYRRRYPRVSDLVVLDAWALEDDYDVVVLVDLRTLVVTPLDDLFDAVLGDELPASVELAPGTTTNVDDDPDRRNNVTAVDTLLTRDLSAVTPERPGVGVGPALLVTRPSKRVHEELRSILIEGDLRSPEEGGWGGALLPGGFWGDATARGVLSRYYDHGDGRARALEIARCRYHNLGGSPTVRADGVSVCRDALARNGKDCEDCRQRTLKTTVVAANTAACRDPWDCRVFGDPGSDGDDNDNDKLRLCREMHEFWFRVRRELEEVWKKKNNNNNNNNNKSYCATEGREGYLAMEPPSQEKGPALNPKAVLNQFATTGSSSVRENEDKDDRSSLLRKPKRRFDPEAVIFQFQDGHPKQGVLDANQQQRHREEENGSN